MGTAPSSLSWAGDGGAAPLVAESIVSFLDKGVAGFAETAADVDPLTGDADNIGGLVLRNFTAHGLSLLPAAPSWGDDDDDGGRDGDGVGGFPDPTGGPRSSSFDPPPRPSNRD